MKNNRISKISECLPEQLLDSAYSLESLGIAELAWNYEDVLNVIDLLFKKDFVIWGGDVYENKYDKLLITHDGWFFDDENLPNDKLLRKAKEKAFLYINNYKQRNGSGYYYSIVAGPVNQI